jgi:hypothetical protein
MILRISKSKALEGVSLVHRTGSHGEGLREGAKNLSPISGFDISKERESGRAQTQKSQNARAGSAFLVRLVFIANDHMEENKGRAIMC